MKIKVKMTRPENLTRFDVTSGTVVTLDMDGEYLPVVVASEVYESESRTLMEASGSMRPRGRRKSRDCNTARTHSYGLIKTWILSRARVRFFVVYNRYI